MNDVSTRVVARAESLLRDSLQQQSSRERAEAGRLARMMHDANGKAFTLAMTDQVFRSGDHAAQARRLSGLLRKFGIPDYLTTSERALLAAGGAVSRVLPSLVMPAVASRLRRDSSRVILPGEAEPLREYLQTRRASGTWVNLNQLGEAILGEEEAAKRMESILAHLANPGISYVSVKISAIFSQINLCDWEGTVNAIQDRLRRLYRGAMQHGKFVNLDMEEYRDLQLTSAAFRRTLDEPEFHTLRAGMVLQAYLPDSWKAQRELTEWARQRVNSGGATIKLRLVKGANLAMEAVDAELHGWTPAPYATKAETDANFRRMLEFGCRPENARVVELGVASHNLFDVALALELRERNGVGEHVGIEMLEGMANHQARAVQKAAQGLLVYAPVVKREDFNSAMSYLVRRLDENTAPENFLHDLFALTPESEAWDRQALRFVNGWHQRDKVSAASRRAVLPPVRNDRFNNTPDTDWTQAANRAALDLAVRGYQAPAVPQAGDLDAVLSAAQRARPDWEALGFVARAKLLRRCATIMAAERFATLATLVHDGKKAAWEADAEISEAVDFANYYAEYRVPGGLAAFALGTVAVTPPWNFPYAIPAGGVFAALMAGNTVILKPAPETAATAWQLVQQCWRAGIPRDVLHFFPCADGETGKALVSDSRVAAIVLTGAYETARLFQSWGPSLRLFAETSGKNALVITAQADRDLAIKDLVKSAFGHAGQKCSAASLAILEAEVYDDPAFRRQLRDAAASLPVGPATHPASVVTPLIRAPGEALRRALATLDPGEEWLLEPRRIGDDPCLWSPGIKLGVKPGGWFHRTECFGPVLGLMCAADLEEAISLQNDSAFGLTGGIHSLDEVEIALWRERVEVGNAYINRPITGAVVQRQPFGGWKQSAIGPGAKAGGPNYVGLFLRLEDTVSCGWDETVENYRRAWHVCFSIGHDPSALRCESNVLRYRPVRGVILRLGGNDESAIRRAHLAAGICGVPLRVSLATDEPDSAFIARLPDLARQAGTIRTVHAPPAAVLAAAHAAGLNWIDAPVVAEGRVELSRWLHEQSVSQTLHRYGQIADEHPGLDKLGGDPVASSLPPSASAAAGSSQLRPAVSEFVAGPR